MGIAVSLFVGAEARLQEFLFGAQRISLDPVRKDLRELQSNRCFYCERDLTEPLDVDHFIPWARYADNGIENLVIAHQRCNAAKSDHLAAADHVDHWSRRFLERDAPLASQLSEIAERARWDRHPHRTLNAARSIYRRLPADVRLWRRQREFVPIGDERALIVRSLELSANTA